MGQKADHYYPTWPLLDLFATTWVHTFLWIFLYFFFYQNIVTAYWQYGFLFLHFLMGPIQGATVNWFGHKLGYRNYSLPNKSKNTVPIDVFLMGELYQNNHHRFTMALNFAKRWFEWHPTYLIILLLKKNRLLRTP